MRPAGQREQREKGKAEAVRRTAERLLGGRLGDGADISDQSIRELAHELSVHQIELELQNEELRRAQRALGVSHQDYVDLYDNAPVGFVTLDSNAVVKQANLTAARLLGIPTRALVNNPFVLHVDPASRSSFYQYLRNILASQTAQTCVISLRSGDGTAIVARLDGRAEQSKDGRPRRVLVSVIDLTRQTKLEEQITISERTLRLAIEQYPAAFVIFSPTGGIEFANSQGALFFGGRAEELIGRNVRELVPGVPDEFVRTLERTVETATPGSSDRSSASQRLFRDHVFTFTPVIDGKGEVQQVLGVAYDNSSQARLQGALEQAVLARTSELQEAIRTLQREADRRKVLAKQVTANQRRLRALSTKLAATAENERHKLAVALHDRIGQALAFTKINLDLIRRSLRDDDASEQIDHVLSVVDQISSDTQSLIFDLNPPVLSLLGLGSAVEWLAEEMQQEHKLRIVVRHEGESDPLPDDVRNLLFRAVKELLTNAVKHSQSPTARVVVRRASRKIQVLVEDDGVGMSPGTLESAKGFGLLSIRERLHELGGSLRINSKPGATRVRIEVPLALAGDTKSDGRARN